MPDSMTLLSWLWQTTWQAAFLAAIVAVLTRVLRDRLSPQARQALWLLVFVRLAMPVLPGSSFSIFRLFPKREQPQQIETAFDVPVTTYFRMARFKQLDRQAISPQPKFDWRHLALGWWMLGTVLFIGQLVISTIRFSRRINRSSREPDPATRAIVEAACKEAEAPALPLFITDLVTTPSLFGVVRPRLLLPASALQRLDSASLRSVILHELEHLNRRHLLADWILSIIRAVHWFNPAAWWAHRQIRNIRELICDQSILRRLDEEHSRGYGLAMLTLAAGVGRPPRAVPIAAFAQEQNLLRQRIEAIASGKRKYIVGLGLILVALVVAVFMTRPRENAPAKEKSDSTPLIPYASAPLRYPDNWPATQPTTQATPADRNVLDAASVFPADPKIVEALNHIVPDAKFDGVPFADVIEFLRDMSRINIFVNWRGLEAAGIDRNTRVTARLRDVKFSKALDTILRDVGGNVRLGYDVDGNVLTISTADDIQINVVTQVYDIRDLIVASEPAVAGTNVSLRQQLSNEIQRLIQDTVGWNKYCSMRELSGQLIITAQPNVHQQVKGLIERLRETRAIQITVEAMVLDLTHESANAIWTALATDPQHPMMDDQMVAKLRTGQTAGDKIITAPRLTLFNGQLASFLIGGPEKDFNLHVQATISADRRSVTMTVRTPANPELAAARRAIGTSSKPATAPFRFERITTSGSTISVPDGATVPIQMKRETFEIQADGSEKSIEMPPDSREVWMLIKPTIIIQREQEQEQFPRLSSHPTSNPSGNR